MTYQEEITKLIRASYDQGAKDAQQETLAALEQIVAAARADEREACADNVETYYDPMWTEHYCAGIELAKMIRARGEA